jgi:hypothetical protein
MEKEVWRHEKGLCIVIDICLTIADTRGLSAGRLGSQIHAGSRCRSKISGSCLVERKLLSDSSEQFPDIRGSLRGGLEEQQASFARIGLCICSWDSTLIGVIGNEIKLVSSKGDHDVLVRLALKFLNPRLGLVERRL